MPGPVPPRRKRFQIHLSTAMVMMFVTGGIIWLNTRGEKDVPYQWDDVTYYTYDSIYGWPVSFVRLNHWIGGPAGTSVEPCWIFFDLIVALILLVIVGFIWQWLIRIVTKKGA